MKTSISAFALRLGMSRQNFYKGRNKQHRIGASRPDSEEEVIEQLVKCKRRLHPRLGGRKLLKVLAPVLENEGIKVGRDRFFDILRKKGLLVPPLPKGPRTSRFEPSLPVFSNLVAGLELTGPNQAWAADISVQTKGFST
jgi:hypothetical protein